MKQKGFATLEVILMVVVIAILASIAVPRFANMSAKANTAKIQADLSTIDTAIAVYQLEKGTDPANIAALVTAGYLQAEPKPPKGFAYLNGDISSAEFSADNYTFVAKSGTVEAHAELGNNKASDFSLTKSGTSSTGGGTQSSSTGGGTQSSPPLGGGD